MREPRLYPISSQSDTPTSDELPMDALSDGLVTLHAIRGTWSQLMMELSAASSNQVQGTYASETLSARSDLALENSTTTPLLISTPIRARCLRIITEEGLL